MANENRMQKWLEIVDRDIDAAEWMQQGGTHSFGLERTDLQQYCRTNQAI